MSGSDKLLVPSRRSFLVGTAALIVAPAIVRAGSLMPVKVIDPYYRRFLIDYLIASDCMALRIDVASHPLPVPRWGRSLTEREAINLMSPEQTKAYRDMKPNSDIRHQLGATVALARLPEWMQ